MLRLIQFENDGVLDSFQEVAQEKQKQQGENRKTANCHFSAESRGRQ